jgi:hypothetical protein
MKSLFIEVYICINYIRFQVFIILYNYIIILEINEKFNKFLINKIKISGTFNINFFKKNLSLSGEKKLNLFLFL